MRFLPLALRLASIIALLTRYRQWPHSVVGSLVQSEAAFSLIRLEHRASLLFWVLILEQVVLISGLIWGVGEVEVFLSSEALPSLLPLQALSEAQALALLSAELEERPPSLLLPSSLLASLLQELPLSPLLLPS